MTKEQLAVNISKKIYKGRGKLDSFHAFPCFHNYLSDFSIDGLKNIAGQYGFETQKVYPNLEEGTCPSPPQKQNNINLTK